MQDKFNENIKNRLQDHEIAPPPMAWENISEELQKEKPRIIPWYRWAGIAAAIAIPALLTIGFLWLNNIDSHENNNELIITNSSENGVNSGENSEKNNSDFNPNNVNSDVNNGDATEEFNNENSTQKNTGIAKNTDQSSGNRVVNFFKEIFAEDGSAELNNNQKSIENTYLVKETHNENNNRRVNVLATLTAPFKNNIGVEMSDPQLYAYYVKNQEKELVITAFGVEEEEEKEEKVKANKNKNLKFEVNPYAGASFLGSFNQASLLAPEFNQLSIDSEMATSFGSHASYKVNDRLKVRSGVGVIDLTQNTYNVPFKFDSNQGAVNYNVMNQSNISPNLSEINSIEQNFANSEALAANTNIIHDIEQNVQFIEVPVELEYRLTNKSKLGVAATGGLSTLFLNKNDVYIKDNSSLVGEPTNLKSVSFSANAGVKMDYKINDKLSVNIEPQFKYMINTITANDDVQPYLVGVNAGVSYSL